MEEEQKQNQQNPDDITPYSNGIPDYKKLIDKFGVQQITPDQLLRIEKLTKRPVHHFLKRQIFFTHRDLDDVLNKYEQKIPFYLYTGRGPSNESMHVGHLIPFMFTKYLQDAFDVPVVIQLTDDEKYFHRGASNTSLDQFTQWGIENAKDIIACGFDINKTFIFLDSDYVGSMYRNVIEFQKNVTFNQLKGIFGVNESDNCGIIAYPAIQAAPSISTSFPHIFGNKLVPCLIPQGVDQDGYFRMTRDVQGKLGIPKCACIHSKFIPSLQGFQNKMSTTVPNSAIFLTDTQEKIAIKMKDSLSGGGKTKQEQLEKGANLELDVAFQYLYIFMENEGELNNIAENYKQGKMMTSEVKSICTKLLSDLVLQHQQKRSQVTDEVVKNYMKIRKLEFAYQ